MLVILSLGIPDEEFLQQVFTRSPHLYSPKKKHSAGNIYQQNTVFTQT